MNTTQLPETGRAFCPMAWAQPRQYELELFAQKLDSFIPPQAFDAHAHLWSCQHLGAVYGWPKDAEYTQTQVTLDKYRERQQQWMGKKSPQNGLFFAMPVRGLDVDAANNFVHNTVSEHPDSRGLLLIKPDDNPVEVEAKVLSQKWAGFKVYHCFADRPDTQNATIGEFLPEWAWDIADQHQLAIMLHQVRQRSLSDPDNQQTINQMCRKYPQAKLILAHAARGFCANDTVEGVHAIADLKNVYFDTSAICESAPFEAILQTFGSTRLLYGSDFGVSEVRGRAVSLGEGFHWIYEWDNESWPLGEPIFVGLESLLALRRACEMTEQSQSDIEKIFRDNAHKVLAL